MIIIFKIIFQISHVDMCLRLKIQELAYFYVLPFIKKLYDNFGLDGQRTHFFYQKNHKNERNLYPKIFFAKK